MLCLFVVFFPCLNKYIFAFPCEIKFKTEFIYCVFIIWERPFRGRHITESSICAYIKSKEKLTQVPDSQ